MSPGSAYSFQPIAIDQRCPPGVNDTRKILRVVVVSPSDTQQERDSLPAILDELNEGIADELGMRLELWRWEDDAHPGLHRDGPQAVIDDQMEIEEADLVIGLFWQRYGTPTADGLPGTVHEISKAIAAAAANGSARPSISVYIREAESRIKTADDARQVAQLLDYLQGLRRQLLTNAYLGVDDFRTRIRKDLTAFVRQMAPRQRASVAGGIPLNDLFPIPRLTDAVDRSAVAEKLRTAMSDSGAVSVEGLPGSGKTYALAQFLRAGGSPLDGPIAWIPVRVAGSVEDILAELATVRPFTSAGTASRLRELVAWFTQIHALLVVDDFHLVEQSGASALLDAFLEAGPPSNLVLTSRTYVDRTHYPHLLGRVQISGLQSNEVDALLDGRELDVPSAMREELASKTEGLPLAVGLFASLVQDFDREPADLLDGTMKASMRLRGWFNEMWDALDAGGRSLLQFLSLAESPFDIGLVKAAAKFLGSNDVDVTFERLEHTYLVQRYSRHRWTIHQLLAAYISDSLDGGARSSIHKAFADWYVTGVPAGGEMDEAAFWWRLRAVRHLQLADSYQNAGALLLTLAPTAKLRGHYEAFMTACRAQLAGDDRRTTAMVIYHLAHCCLIVGRAREALHWLGSDDAGRNLADERLRAEALRELGRPQEALDTLESALKHAPVANAVAIAHAESIQVALLTDVGQSARAREIAQRNLDTATRRSNNRGAAVLLARLALLAHQSDGPDETVRLLTRSLEMFDRLGDRRGSAWARCLLCEVALDHNSPIDLSLVRSGLTARREIGEAERGYLVLLQRLRPAVGDDEALVGLVESEQLRVEEALRADNGERKV
jgi:tetratricopeptide (TPR) repeat protein